METKEAGSHTHKTVYVRKEEESSRKGKKKIEEW